jgi:hypothetical protein
MYKGPAGPFVILGSMLVFCSHRPHLVREGNPTDHDQKVAVEPKS